MRIITPDCKNRLYIGYIIENEAVAVKLPLDISAYPSGGMVTLLHQRPGEKEAYPCVTRIEGNSVVWEVRKADVQNIGWGKAELIYTVGNTVAHLARYTTSIADSLDSSEDVPPAYEMWVNEVLTQTAKVVSMTAEANTLDPEQPATADYSDGVMRFGIPRGADGKDGLPGKEIHIENPYDDEPIKRELQAVSGSVQEIGNAVDTEKKERQDADAAFETELGKKANAAEVEESLGEVNQHISDLQTEVDMGIYADTEGYLCLREVEDGE